MNVNFRLGVSLFALLSIIGFILVFFLSTETAPIAAVVDRLELPYLLLCVFAVPVADWAIAGLRMWMFTHAACPDISYFACVKNCAVGSFMGAATPSQTGGGIAQVYVLVKEGANAGQAVSVLFLTFLSTLVFYALACIGLWGLDASGRLPDMGGSAPFALAALLFGGLATGGFLVLLFPHKVIVWLQGVVDWAQSRKRLGRLAAQLVLHLQDGSATVQLLFRKYKMRFVLSIPVTVAVFANKYFAAYLAARALGIETSLTQLMIIQLFLHILLYFLPTPGGSVGAEVGTAVLMQSLIPSSLLPAYTLLWRTSIMYFSVLVGGLILIRYIRQKPRGNVPTMETVEMMDDTRN
jgi:glycosyltransferase 2 family protein